MPPGDQAAGSGADASRKTRASWSPTDHRRLRPGSLRCRLTAWYGGILASVLLLTAISLYRSARKSLLGKQDIVLTLSAQYLTKAAQGNAGKAPTATELIRSMEDLANVSGDFALTEEHDRWEWLHQMRMSPHALYVRIVDPQSKTSLAVSSALKRTPILTAFLDSILRDGTFGVASFALVGPNQRQRLRVRTSTIMVGGKAALLQIAVPCAHEAQMLEYFALILVIGVPAIVLIATLGGWVLVSRTLQPIGRIVTQARLLDANALPKELVAAPTETDSEIDQLVTTLNDMITRLHQAFEAQAQFAAVQQRFVADASHELRTPLTVLRGEIELALTRPRNVDQYRATLTSAIEEIRRMGRIVDGLTTLARGDAGVMLSRDGFGCVDLLDLAYGVVCDFKTRALEKEITLTLRQTDDPVRSACVQGDAGLLRQLLCNLVDNALKYTPARGCVTVSVSMPDAAETMEAKTTEAEMQRPMVIVEVKDTGVGIASEELPHIFERFWRADRSRSAGGSGLGLAICAQIVEAHDGRMEVESQPGQGSLFRIQLPHTE